MRVVICGGGKVGFFLAGHLFETGNQVVLIEQNNALCERIAEQLPHILVIKGDGCEPRCLEEAEVGSAEVVVAVTGDDEDNLIICQLAKSSFSVPRTIAKVNDPRNEYALTQLGVDNAVNATAIIAQMINQEVSLDEISTLLKLKHGNISIVKSQLSKKSPLCGKALKDVTLPDKCIIATVVRNNEMIVPRGETVLMENDEVLAISVPDSEQKLRRLLTGTHHA